MSEPAVSGEALDLLREVSTATLTLLLYKRGLTHAAVSGVRAITPEAPRMVGPAYTLRFIPMREDLVAPSLIGQDTASRRAIDGIPAGHVLVIDTRGTAEAGTLGDILVARLVARGAAGVVSDGSMRDAGEIGRMALPVFCRAVAAPPSFNRLMAADAQLPVGCGEVAVFPGDIVVGDGDGVVVVPRHLAEELAREGVEQERLERFLRGRIDAGAPIAGTYPPDEATREAYRAWRGTSS